MIGATQKVDVYHLRRTGEVRILVAVLDITKIPKFADVCVKGCMYRLFFKPDEEVIKVANQEEDEDLLTDDDKGKDADGDREMGDADPSPKPQGGDMEKSATTNTKPSTSQSGPSHRQATLIQEALDMACEQLFDDISIKVMLEKDSEGLNHYIPLTEEERRMYNTIVAPPINPHPFFSDKVEQVRGFSCDHAFADDDFLSSVGGTPLFFYPEATTTYPVQEVGGIVSAQLLSSGGDAGAPVGSTPQPLSAVAMEVGAAIAEGDIPLPTDGVEEMTMAAEVVAVVTAEETDVAATAEVEDPHAAVGEFTLEVDSHTAPALGASVSTLPVAPAATSPDVGAPRVEHTKVTLRRSSRNAGKADEHTLLKTERLAKKKNLEGNSFSSFSDSRIFSNLGRVGISLNTSDVVIIKNLEVDRLVLSANKNTIANPTNLISEDEREERLEEVLSHACGNLNESLLDAENDHIIDLSPSRRKKKYNNAKNLRKGKLPKKPKTPSKIIIK
jgi:hypothetical protein